MIGQDLIVLNSFEAAYDLLHKRGAIYSDRPGMSLTRDHGGWKFMLGTEPYGESFHIKRRLTNQSLNPSASKKYYDIMTDHINTFVLHLLRHPSNFRTYNRTYTGANIMMMSYGHQVVDENDEWIRNAEEAATTVDTLGVHPIDVWPFLGKLPLWLWGPNLVRRIERMKKATYQVSTVPYEIVKQQFFEGVAVPSMARNLIEENLQADGSVMYEESINGALAGAYLAGADTSVSVLDTFVIAMILHPEIQHEAQKTIDDLLQSERLPTFEDRGKLPLVDAILKEVLRWKPVLPGGIPHRSIEDDEYKGMYIRKGSTVIFNVLGMMYNVKDFPEPSKFDPHRFLTSADGGKDYSLRTDIQDPETITFGFGRRICPGRHVALSWMWITIATLLAVFKISPELDDDGKPILPNLDYEQALVSHPKQFGSRLKPRPGMALLLGDY
ncbi:cytochrome P450 [Sistotremastrum suecicum HHB10207 ss-3]|uniref:Cytochrome P450 n=1 Tax=Sistotremastrum suecicum HHB10207 ss-3 TaxID=1314776 RepID=A0A165YI83_9AGAM|nr:cytochrome P450 [Sistotremastrum suecicum HHB10207 ss-3]